MRSRILQLTLYTLTFTAWIHVCNGQCTSTPSDGGTDPGCTFEGKYLGPGDTFLTDSCMRFTCRGYGAYIYCSEHEGFTIASYPAGCKVIKTAHGCGERAVRVDDESIECIQGVTTVLIPT